MFDSRNIAKLSSATTKFGNMGKNVPAQVYLRQSFHAITSLLKKRL
jgi:hypothetical protein